MHTFKIENVFQCRYNRTIGVVLGPCVTYLAIDCKKLHSTNYFDGSLIFDQHLAHLILFELWTINSPFTFREMLSVIIITK